jgi:hypothetical protein
VGLKPTANRRRVSFALLDSVWEAHAAGRSKLAGLALKASLRDGRTSEFWGGVTGRQRTFSPRPGTCGRRKVYVLCTSGKAHTPPLSLFSPEFPECSSNSLDFVLSDLLPPSPFCCCRPWFPAGSVCIKSLLSCFTLFVPGSPAQNIRTRDFVQGNQDTSLASTHIALQTDRRRHGHSCLVNLVKHLHLDRGCRTGRRLES